mmetsp:Transcript_55659/g.132717  ORF Transcript_55659/g.132717 Transcript_55659/m.132717 type:complete len:250 (-) Transcript_55659:63-812(-)
MKSPADTAMVHPRRKAGQAKLGRGAPSVVVTRGDLEKLQHLRLSEASTQLGLSATTVKKLCRTLGIFKWSNTSLEEHCDDRHSSSPLSNSDTSAHDSKHTSDFNGVPAPFSITDGMHIDRAAAPVKLGPASSRSSMSPIDEWKPTPSYTSEQRWWTPKLEAATAAQQQGSSAATPQSSRTTSTSSEMPSSTSEDMESDDDFVSLARHVSFVLQQKEPLETSPLLPPMSFEEPWQVDPLLIAHKHFQLGA